MNTVTTILIYLTLAGALIPQLSIAAMSTLTNTDLKKVQSSPNPPGQDSSSDNATEGQHAVPEFGEVAPQPGNSNYLQIESLIAMPEYQNFIAHCKKLEKISQTQNHNKIVASDIFYSFFKKFLASSRDFNAQMHKLTGGMSDKRILSFAHAQQRNLEIANRFYRQLHLSQSGRAPQPDLRGLVTEIQYADLAQKYNLGYGSNKNSNRRKRVY